MLVIDKKTIEKNYEYIRDYTNSEIIPVLKSDAYGHGLAEISEIFNNKKVNCLAVSVVEEANIIREHNNMLPILIFSYVENKYLNEIIKKNYILSLNSFEELEIYSNTMKNNIKNIKFHINLNTCMNRHGFNMEDLDNLIIKIKNLKLNISGIYTHLKDIISSKEIEELYARYNEMVKKIEKNGIKCEIKHVFSTKQAFSYKKKESFIRIGMGLYGMQPFKEKKINNLHQAMSWKSIITGIRKIKKGEIIGYGNSFITKKDMTIAIVPIGYGNGYIKNFLKKGYVLINDKKIKVIGDICMNNIFLDISSINDVKIEQEVIILGKDKKNSISLEEMASWTNNSCAEEIACIIGKLNKKIFI